MFWLCLCICAAHTAGSRTASKAVLQALEGLAPRKNDQTSKASATVNVGSGESRVITDTLGITNIGDTTEPLDPHVLSTTDLGNWSDLTDVLGTTDFGKTDSSGSRGTTDPLVLLSTHPLAYCKGSPFEKAENWAGAMKNWAGANRVQVDSHGDCASTVGIVTEAQAELPGTINPTPWITIENPAAQNAPHFLCLSNDGSPAGPKEVGTCYFAKIAGLLGPTVDQDVEVSHLAVNGCESKWTGSKWTCREKAVIQNGRVVEGFFRHPTEWTMPDPVVKKLMEAFHVQIDASGQRYKKHKSIWIRSLEDQSQNLVAKATVKFRFVHMYQ